MYETRAVSERKPEKRKSGLNGIRTHDLLDVGAVHYQLRLGAGHEHNCDRLSVIDVEFDCNESEMMLMMTRRTTTGMMMMKKMIVVMMMMMMTMMMMMMMMMTMMMMMITRLQTRRRPLSM